MDDLLPDGSLSARRLAELGATVEEIADELEISEREASERMGEVTPAQLRRMEHKHVARGIGRRARIEFREGKLVTLEEGLAPHVQAQQSVLGAYMPETYGRQAQAGAGTLRVIVDSGYTLRAQLEQPLEGETVPVLLPPSGGS